MKWGEVLNNFILEVWDLIGYQDSTHWKEENPVGKKFGGVSGISGGHWFEKAVATEVVLEDEQILVVIFAVSKKQVVEVDNIVLLLGV